MSAGLLRTATHAYSLRVVSVWEETAAGWSRCFQRSRPAALDMEPVAYGVTGPCFNIASCERGVVSLVGVSLFALGNNKEGRNFSHFSIRQLALILLDNAIKYTPAGGKISIRLESQGDDAVLSVSDTGVGISSEDLPHIFERFFRADRSRKAGGTGLGLSIAKWIVEQHGGAINVSSVLGHGTTFVVRLPTT